MTSFLVTRKHKQKVVHSIIINFQKFFFFNFVANESIKRSKSIHEILNNHKPPPPPLKTESFHKIDSPIQTHQQNDACIQTLGLEEPTNQSLRQINGKLQITKSLTNSSTSSSFSSHSSYNSTSVSENYSITNKCNQIKMISASHLNSKEEYEISQMFPRYVN